MELHFLIIFSVNNFIKEQKKRTRDGTNVRVSHDLGQTGSQRLTMCNRVSVTHK